MTALEEILTKKLDKRIEENSLRTLQYYPSLVDFCSNDYLGLARSAELQTQIKSIEATFVSHRFGATGSRLIAGHHPYYDETESLIASTHEAQSALLFNSGYAANLAVLSCLPQRGDTVLYDELSHACIKDGIRLSMANRFPFKHNNLEDLEQKLKKACGTIFIAVEAIYSMDGDQAPLLQLSQVAAKYNAHIIVDEAHSTGIYGAKGAGLVQSLGLTSQIFCRIHTYGKAMGCHGAAAVGSSVLKQYLINFSRPFIFTTALPLSNIAAIHASYLFLINNENLVHKVNQKIAYFKKRLKLNADKLIPSNSPIQIVLFEGNNNARKAAEILRENGLDVRAILSPTVKKGLERIRICIHTYNTEEEIDNLTNCINTLTKDE